MQIVVQFFQTYNAAIAFYSFAALGVAMAITMFPSEWPR
jgi:hypothetical protein